MNKSIEAFYQAHGAFLILVGYRILLAACVLALTLLLARLVRRRTRALLLRLGCVDDNLLPILGSLMATGIYLIGATILLGIFGANSGSLLAILGTAGLAIGLALKNTLANIAAGIMLLVLRPFEAGEEIVCGAVKGKVREINLFTTLLDTPEGVLLAAPNSSLWGAPIQNLNRPAEHCFQATFPLVNAVCFETLEQPCRRVLQNVEGICLDPPPQIRLRITEDQTPQLEVRAWFRSEVYCQTYGSIREALYETLVAEKALLTQEVEASE